MTTTRLLRFDPTLGAGISAGRGRWPVYRGAERPLMTVARDGPIGRTAQDRTAPWGGLELGVRSR